MKKKKICIVTGARSEYGLLKPLMDIINKDKNLQLQVIATGMHLSSEFGLTYIEIENDKIKIDEKIEILLSSDTTVGITKSMGLALISFGEVFQRLLPDLLIVLGDRFETLSTVIAAYTSGIPIAHIHGGETTEGAIDEGFRHSITKMSYMHFTATEEYRKRVIQLGESPDRVFNVGAIGIDNIKKLKLLNKSSLEKALNIKFKTKNLLINFHPVTIEKSNTKIQFENLLNALDGLEDTLLIFTKSNADSAGRIINKMIDEYTVRKKNAVSFTSMGSLKYLSTLQFVDIVIGNSSSGIIEAPSFNIGTINIGVRQEGRIKSTSVIDCLPETKSIIASIKKIYTKEFQDSLAKIVNPYDGGNTAQRIMKIIKSRISTISLKKSFYDL